MSINHYRQFYNPQCDRCGALNRAGWSEEEAKRIAEADGWRRIGNDGQEEYICPLCRRKEKEAQARDSVS